MVKTHDARHSRKGFRTVPGAGSACRAPRINNVLGDTRVRVLKLPEFQVPVLGWAWFGKYFCEGQACSRSKSLMFLTEMDRACSRLWGPDF